jgi:hypothetical protein
MRIDRRGYRPARRVETAGVRELAGGDHAQIETDVARRATYADRE